MRRAAVLGLVVVAGLAAPARASTLDLFGFGMRSQIDFAPGKGHVVRLPFDLPVVGTDVSAVMLASHEPSPLARQLLGHIRDLVAEAVPTPAMAAALAAGG